MAKSNELAMTGPKKARGVGLDDFKPSEFMKSRRPHLFSDTEVRAEFALPREVLEQQLDTLTSRRQEIQFEHFCRRLAEQELAPNLRPQTGPTGGGDSKVDSETYPVSEEIAQRWYVGNTEAAQGDWAFAFSAKRDWKSKAKADIAGIIAASKNYSRIYFITNQFARDKDRAELESILSTKAEIPVTILDRSWILARIYEHGRLSIAIETLGLSSTQRDEPRSGPLDRSREVEIADLDAQIADSGRYVGTPYSLAEDAMRGALIARGLARPRFEVDGRFAQAKRAAATAGLPSQQLRISYNHAWTNFFWFDDAIAFIEAYEEVESFASGSMNAADWDRIVILYSVLQTAVRRGVISRDRADLGPKRERLLKALDAIAEVADRPNNALTARAGRLHVQLVEIVAEGQVARLDSVWEGFREVLRECRGLGSFDFRGVSDLLDEIGEHVPESDTFDQLSEERIDLLQERTSEGEAGRAYVRRAIQKLQKESFYEAIRLFGRALERLLKDEYETDLGTALVGLSHAYDRVGLRWASRNAALAAASHTCAAFERRGEIHLAMWQPLDRLLASEAALGRMPYCLKVYHLAAALRSSVSSIEGRSELIEYQAETGTVLGSVLLRIDDDAARAARQLPDILGRLGLDIARVALLHRLGHDDILRSEQSLPDGEQEGDIFDRLSKISCDLELTDDVDFYIESETVLQSNILGCIFTVTCARQYYYVGLGAALLGALEALLSTSMSTDTAIHADKFDIAIREADDSAKPINYEFEDESGSTTFVIRVDLDFLSQMPSNMNIYRDWLFDAIVAIALRVTYSFDRKAWLEKLGGEERAFARALIFSDVVSMERNLFGAPAPWDFSAEDAPPASYQLKVGCRYQSPPRPEDADEWTPPKFGEGEAPPELSEREKRRHTDIRVLSLIDVPKWDVARWRAVHFMSVEGREDIPPVLSLIFEDEQAGRTIFEGLRQRLGRIDEDGMLRVVVIRGIDARNPHHYAVLIGSNIFNNDEIRKGCEFRTVFRIQRMTPDGPANLERFLSAAALSNRYLLAPAGLEEVNRGGRPLIDLAIGKYELIVLQAWEIGDNDPDILGIDVEHEPVIPPGVEDAPVLAALARRRSFLNRSNG